MNLSKNSGLSEKIHNYVQRDIYPMHMPGHKRNMPASLQEKLSRIWEMDLTEVEGSDSLHHAKGIIKEAQDYAASVYGAKESFFLVNGSTCGILSAIHACADSKRSKIIMAKESHMSAYNAISLNRLEPVLIESYTAGVYEADFASTTELTFSAGVNTKLLYSAIEKHHRDACAVFITSPTYEGMVSDIQNIAEFAHRHRLPLIVDEAHGAHLRFMKEFTGISSAINLGADIVIQSVHKTLPALTQSAILHLSDSKFTDREKIRESLMIFESSSPSYVLMSSIDLAIRYMAGAKREIGRLFQMRKEFYDKCRALQNVKVAQEYRIYGDDDQCDTFFPAVWDMLKVVVYSKRLQGRELADLLRNDYLLEPEMAAGDYVLCMFTVGDTKEGIDRLYLALKDLDERMKSGFHGSRERPVRMDLHALCKMKAKRHIYAFPPDIPIVRKGERISISHIRKMEDALKKGLNIYGLEDYGKDIYSDGEERFR